jgi:hypothetical protein
VETYIVRFDNHNQICIKADSLDHMDGLITLLKETHAEAIFSPAQIQGVYRSDLQEQEQESQIGNPVQSQGDD